ncbi:MAG: LppC family lipoprotein [Piscirickettsiaceae bacterium]|nr:MAG: LppC family lipoprotein [Piscirickettsiaceae bacterium]
MEHSNDMSALFRRLFFIAIIAVSLTHCTSVPNGHIEQPAPNNALLEQAQLASSQNKHLQAAKLYEQLAKNVSSNEAENFLGMAADAYLKGGDINSAERIVATLSSQSTGIQLLQASILLKQGKTEQSGRVLDAINTGLLTNSQRIELHTLRSSAFFQSGNLYESARERVKLDALALPTDERILNQNALVETLQLLSIQALDILKPVPNDPMFAWIELAIALKVQPSNNNPAITLWRQNYPTHSANNGLLPHLLQKGQQAHKPSGKVAVFLPNTGPYASTAQQIRQGIMSAAYTLDNTTTNVTFYDSHNTAITTLYQQALRDGMQAIIGPLDKQRVAELHQLPDHSIPVIALNKFEGNAPNQTVSLSLNPEDDVVQVASLVWLKGYQRALILTPQTKFGQRLASHFANIWQQFGGTINGVQTYNPKQADYSTSIKSLLHIDNSQNRFKQLRRQLNLSIEFKERRRQDVDFIFLIASPRDGRLIKPQLRFHHATQLPVFSTGKIYDGNHNPVANSDLDDVYFCDIPSLIEPNNYVEIDTTSLSNQWGLSGGSSKRLFALGVDAYQAITQIDRLKNNTLARFSGSTGILSMTPQGKVNRQLSCATFKRGKIKPLGLAPHLEKADVFQPLEHTATPNASSIAIPL